MKTSKIFGEVEDIQHKKIILQGNSKAITLSKYLGDAESVLLYVVKNDPRYLHIIIDKKPEGNQ